PLRGRGPGGLHLRAGRRAVGRRGRGAEPARAGPEPGRDRGGARRRRPGRDARQASSGVGPDLREGVTEAAMAGQSIYPSFRYKDAPGAIAWLVEALGFV